MKNRRLYIVLVFLLALTCSAEPISEFRICPQCRGKRSLSLTPPNLGQFDGDIGVTPGKPFTTHRWDVKIPNCPICGGTGRVEKYRTHVVSPKPEDAVDCDKCPECRWSGVTTCGKCLGQGALPCHTCKYSPRGGKPGWIKSETRTAGPRSKHVKVVVSPCDTCQGVGKVVCPDCLGKGAKPCRKCKGAGGLPRKGRH